MSLFQCEHCGCVENTALACQGFKGFPEQWFDWTGIEDRKGKLLCCACGPSHFSKGELSPFGEWHGKFERVYLPKGQFKTNNVGNLEHIDTGDDNYSAYRIYPEDFQ